MCSAYYIAEHTPIEVVVVVEVVASGVVVDSREAEGGAGSA